VFGGGDRIAERRVHHDDAMRGGGGNVDIVDADAGAPDHFELLGLLQQLGGDLGRRADGEAVIVADDFGELLLVEAGFDVDLDAALLKDGDGGGGELVGDENARGHGGSLCCRPLPRKRGEESERMGRRASPEEWN
jgi:hypothetical protein